MRLNATFSVVLAVLACGTHVQAKTIELLLKTRQTTPPNVPQQCQSTCNAVLNVLANVRTIKSPSPVLFSPDAHVIQTCNISQCCTNSFLQGLFDCYTCLAGVVGNTNFTADQASVDG